MSSCFDIKYSKAEWLTWNVNFRPVERQAQHRPNRLKMPRTGSAGTDRLGRVRKPVRRPVRRKAGSVQKPGGRRKDIPQGIYLGVSVGVHK